MTQLDKEQIADWARTEREKIERSAMNDQPGWMQRLSRLSDQKREIALRPLLPTPLFERWRIFTEVSSQSG